MIVVGAGVMGCGTAYWLSKAGYTSRACEIRGRIADQANQLIKHFYSLGAYLSASNFPGAADPSKITLRKVDTIGLELNCSLTFAVAISYRRSMSARGASLSLVLPRADHTSDV